jgi:hypothetical protein
MNRFARRVVACACGAMIATTIIASSAGSALAAGNPAGTGQPSQECGEEDTGMTPGHSATAPGSPFNEDGVSGTHYAGEQPQNSKNTHSVSQYDVACFQVTSNH